MKRSNPFTSPLSLSLALALFIGLGVSLWFNQGLAFSPGVVTAKSRAGVTLEGYASHVEFEPQCGWCHDPLRATLAEKCIACHTAVGQQLASGQGLHAGMQQVTRCETCHPEHCGRQFDPSAASHAFFDHSLAAFSLAWHQLDYDATPLACEECHSGETFGVVLDETCAV